MSERVPRRRGRRPAGEDTRGEILAAARTVFAAKGYEAATLRGIAREAGVDPRLVHHYFSGKEDVFVEAMQLPLRPATVIGAAVEHGLDGLGERIVRAFFLAWDGPQQRERIVTLLGSAATNPQGARMLREFVVREVLGRVLGQVSGPDAELRVELAAAQLIGMAVVRYVVQAEPMASVPVERLVGMLAPVVQRYLDGTSAGADEATGRSRGVRASGGGPSGGGVRANGGAPNGGGPAED
jgi:AcrR family transcriptional regulator